MDLTVLWDVWGERSGYVFVPAAKRAKAGDHRAATWDEGPAFSWPEDRDAITGRVEALVAGEWDVYWCPLVFAKPQRRKMAAREMQGWLYADLDTVLPRDVEPKATWAWASSKGRYQALWRLGREHPVAEIEAHSRGIAYATGADKSGWDITQVLRVPGTMNYKHDPPQAVSKALGRAERVYEITIFPAASAVDTVSGIAAADSLDALLGPYKLSSRTIELAFAKVTTGDRSERLWELAKLLIEDGVPIATVAGVLKASVWNKYRGRKDEDHRLMTDALKAEAEYREHLASPKLAVVKPTAGEESWPMRYSRFLTYRLPAPAWLVEGVWQAGSYGLMAGDPKTYKSVIATDLGLSVASGKPFLGVFPVRTTGSVLYAQEENGPATVQDRVIKIAKAKGLIPADSFAALPPDLPFYVSNNIGLTLTDEDHRKQLETAVARLGLALLILDPLYMMLGDSDENNSKEMRPILMFLTSLRDKYGCGTIVLHHFRKQQQGTTKMRGGGKVRGSGVFHGWTESAMYMEALTDCIRVEREFRSFPKQPDLRIRIEMSEPGTYIYTPEVLKDEDTITMSSEVKKEELLALLADNPTGLDADTLRAELRASRPKVVQWLKDLVGDGQIETVRKGGKAVYRLTSSGKGSAVKIREEASV